ncbi:MAG: UPF0236 family transposase-like protein [Nitrososphaera sp.]
MIRPFSESAEVVCRTCSIPLQRTITDFGADASFGGGAAAKLKEHYGIEVPATVIRAITEKHGEAMGEIERQQQSELPKGPGVSVLIVETDGSMVPVVETAEPVAGEAPIDRRKTRKLKWNEALLGLVHQPGSVTPIFGATMGTVDEAGEQLWRSAIRAGAGSQTTFHGVGDGATWITNQLDLRFGTRATYLVDFYHLCGYVARAAEVVAGEGKEAWIKEKKDWLKDNRWPDVLKSLQPYLEGEKVLDQDAPVRACYRYISNRPKFLDYKSALAAGLPIGSGEIESAHRYVIQIRLKIAGAWWKIENAEKMLALRVMRVNGDWEKYWEKAA